MIDTEALTELVVSALEDLKGADIRTLDVRGKTSITDVMVIASGNTDRQVKALANSVIGRAKGQGIRPLGVEGERSGEWIVIDLADVVVHVMQPRVRDFYNLEKLWGDDAPAAAAKGP